MSTSTRAYAELEVALHRAQAEGYQVELRFSSPRSEAEVPPERGLAAFDLADLLGLQSDPEAYGERLAEGLFQDSDVRALYTRAKTAVEAADLLLRLRLLIGPSALELQALRWELLRDPQTNAPLATSEKTLFSRFMVSSDWRPVGLRPRSQLTALVAVAAPANLEKYALADVDLEGEIDRARESLKGIRVTVIGHGEPLTLQRLSDGLRDGVDVLYLVCHGAIHRKTREGVLYLQKDDGSVGVARGAELARRVCELTQPPRLVVLASCDSAAAPRSPGDATAQSALAPLLAEAGVPAVLAMQGKITMETVKRAMPVFFAELLRDGQIDRALAVARGTVRDRGDSWMPALYLRLKGGRIWYEPGFAGEEDRFKKWKSITGSVRRGTFVPILGPGLAERTRGTSRELAESLAREHGFPMAPYQRTDLAQVAQYLAVHQSRQFALDEIHEGLRAQILMHHPHLGSNGTDLKTLFKDVVRERYPDENDPLRILAGLRGSIYVNANADPMLPLALAEAGAKPKLLFSNWRKTWDSHPEEPAYKGVPDAEHPIVHYAFGFLAKGESMVLTEDDFFDFLIAATDYKLIPRVVRSALVESSLLFLGFSLDDWPFRVLFRLIMSLDGSAHLSNYAHVGVQIDPAEHDFADVERAREYLQEYYFGSGPAAPHIDIYWGTVGDFLNELRVELEKTAGQPAAALIDKDDDEDDWVSL